jgi:hypothetical protein
VRIYTKAELEVKMEIAGLEPVDSHRAHALHSPYWWLKCLFWSSAERNPLVRGYHRLLVWDLMQKPWLTQTLEKMLNPFIGKSIAMYYVKAKFPRVE